MDGKFKSVCILSERDMRNCLRNGGNKYIEERKRTKNESEDKHMGRGCQ